MQHHSGFKNYRQNPKWKLSTSRDKGRENKDISVAYLGWF
jgi:hypothetical protein